MLLEVGAKVSTWGPNDGRDEEVNESALDALDDLAVFCECALGSMDRKIRVGLIDETV